MKNWFFPLFAFFTGLLMVSLMGVGSGCRQPARHALASSPKAAVSVKNLLIPSAHASCDTGTCCANRGCPTGDLHWDHVTRSTCSTLGGREWVLDDECR